jgi:tetratricopeptide (TPR) repeat protein
LNGATVTIDWRSIPGNEHAFDRLRELVTSGEAIAFVGAGASAGLYPLWGELIRELVSQAASRGATNADQKYWLQNFHNNPDVVIAGIKHTLGPGIYAELLREIFRPKAGLDGRYFTPLHATLIQLPFRGYITTNFDPGLLEARLQLRPDSRPTGFGTWRDQDVVERWRTGDIFREQPCPLLFAHGIYERSDTIVLDTDQYRQAYRAGPFRRLFEAIWKQRHIVFVGSSFSDQWIKTVASEGLFSGTYSTAPQHLALLGLRSQDEYTPEMRRATSDQYGAEVLFYPIVPVSEERDDHGALKSILDEVAGKSSKSAQLPGPQTADAKSLSAAPPLPQRWIHETTEDEYFTGRSQDLSRLDRWSADPDVRVIAITGMGGLGKTSLVAHWLKNKGSNILLRSIKGVLFWSIYADRDVKSLFQAITRFAVDELGVAPPQGKVDIAATALDMLRNTSMLLVIDGLELLQDLPSASGYGALLREELRELLDGACRLRHDSLVLLTSRFPFSDLDLYLGRGLRGRHLDRLSDAEGAALLAACDVGGTNAERESASRKFNGHPLGLRLLALALLQRGGGDPGRLIEQVFDKAALSEEIPLERKLKHLLDFYEKGMPRIQVALIGIVSFFRSLAPKRTILALARRLPAVADATKGSSDIELQDALAVLSRQHLLIGDPAEEAWSCHPILRDHFRQSLLDWAPGIATGAANILTARPSLDIPKDIHALESVLAAIELLLDANDFAGADQLYRERLNNGRVFRQLAAPSEGMRCALGFVRDERRGRCERVLKKTGLAAYINTVGVSARETGEFEFGTRYLEECTAIYRECNLNVELSRGLQNWTGLLIILGRLADAERRASEAIIAATDAGADAEERGSLTYLGTVLGKRGRIADALAAFASATDLERRISREVEGLFSRRGIRFADLLLRLGRTGDAQYLTEANLRICVENDWQEETAQCWSVLAEIALKNSLFSQANAQLDAAEGVFRNGHTVSQIPRILLTRGELEVRQGNWERAGAAIEEALTLAAPREMRLDHADILVLRARLALCQATRDGVAPTVTEIFVNRAIDDCDSALEIARNCGYVWAERDALVLLAQSHGLIGSTDNGLSFARDAEALSARLADTNPPATGHS